MQPLIVVGAGLCAGVITTGLRAAAVSVRWLAPHTNDVPSLDTPSQPPAHKPSLLIPSGIIWRSTPAMNQEALDSFAQWLEKLAPDADVQVGLARLDARLAEDNTPGAGFQVGSLDAGALWDVLLARATALGITPERYAEITPHWTGERVTGVRAGDLEIAAETVIQAEGVRLDTIWHLPEVSPDTLGQRVLLLPEPPADPSSWSYLYPHQERVYLDADRPAPMPPLLPQAPESAQPVSGIRGFADPGTAITRIAPGYVRVTMSGGGGLLDAPLLVPQLLAVLGITHSSGSESERP